MKPVFFESAARFRRWLQEHHARERELVVGFRKASAFFEAQPPGYRRLAVHWIMSAKKEETRERRFRHLVDRSASDARIDLVRPFRSGAE